MSISNSTQPSAYKSACGPAGWPDACSGDRYATVPSTPAVPVTVVVPSARAMPKSSTLTCPPASTTFAGVMSRCTSPAACATSSASQTSAAIRTASPAGSIPAWSRTCRRVRPSTSSITMNGVAPSTPQSNTVTRRGWLSRAACRASRSNRARKPGSAAYCRLSTLTATSRPSTWSLARHTVAMPPVPSTSPSAYRPPRTPVPVTATTDPPAGGPPAPCPTGLASGPGTAPPPALSCPLRQYRPWPLRS